MEFFIEELLSLALEGSFNLSANKKVPLPIRILLIVLASAFLLAVTVGLVVIGVVIIAKGQPWGGIFIGAIGLVLSVLSVVKIVKVSSKSFSKEKDGLTK